MKALLVMLTFIMSSFSYAGTVALYDESKKDVFIQTIEEISTDIKWTRDGAVSITTEQNGVASCIISNEILKKIKVDKISFMKIAMEPQTQIRCYLKDNSIEAKEIAIVINRNSK